MKLRGWPREREQMSIRCGKCRLLAPQCVAVRSQLETRWIALARWVDNAACMSITSITEGYFLWYHKSVSLLAFSPYMNIRGRKLGNSSPLAPI